MLGHTSCTSYMRAEIKIRRSWFLSSVERSEFPMEVALKQKQGPPPAKRSQVASWQWSGTKPTTCPSCLWCLYVQVCEHLPGCCQSSLHQFIFPPAGMRKGSKFSTSSLTLVTTCLLDYSPEKSSLPIPGGHFFHDPSLLPGFSPWNSLTSP